MIRCTTGIGDLTLAVTLGAALTLPIAVVFFQMLQLEIREQWNCELKGRSACATALMAIGPRIVTACVGTKDGKILAASESGVPPPANQKKL
eukprot:3750236-Amphidinium_carterae.1